MVHESHKWWQSIYRGIEEELPSDMPIPLWKLVWTSLHALMPIYIKIKLLDVL